MREFVSSRTLSASDVSRILIYPNWAEVLDEEDVRLILRKIAENEVRDDRVFLMMYHARHHALRGLEFAVLCSYFRINVVEVRNCCERMIRNQEVTLYSVSRAFELLTKEANLTTARQVVNRRIAGNRRLEQEMNFFCYRPQRHRITPMQLYVLCEEFGVAFLELARRLECEMLDVMN